MAYRFTVVEKDLSGRPVIQTNEYGAAAGTAVKGTIGKPILIRTTDDIKQRLGGIPSDYSHLLEINSYRQVAPIWYSRMIGLNYLYAGVHVKDTAVIPFGSRTGNTPSAINYALMQLNDTEVLGTGDGINADFTGTLPNTPITDGTLKIYKGTTLLAASDSAGNITGVDISGTGTVDLGTGAISFTVTGTPGAVATYTTDVDLVSSPIDTTLLVKPLAFNLTIDGVTYENIQTGTADASFNQADLITLINTAVGSVVASISGNFVQVDGIVGDASIGEVTFEPPTDLTTYDNGIAQLIDSTYVSGSVEGTAATNPSGAIPANGTSISVDYIYTDDISLTASHSIFAESPFNDSEYTMYLDIEHLGGSQFTVSVYEALGSTYTLLKEYTYSLIQEKDANGKSLYYEDVFKNTPYIFIKKNDAYTGTTSFSAVTKLQMSGGYAGDALSSADKLAAWDPFKKAVTYGVKTFLDIDGTQYNNIKSIVDTYQPYANIISTVPLGNDYAGQITYRQGTGLNTDKIAMICAWRLVKNPFEDNNAWISSVGAFGANYAKMEPYYDALSPAGIEARGLPAGNVSDYEIIELENDYDEIELEALNNAQLNPLVYNQGLSTYYFRGDNTLLSIASDTRRIKNRRVYDLMISSTIETLLIQEFKNNDAGSRQLVKSQIDGLLNPILLGGYVRVYESVCDESNNTDEVLNAEEFVFDIYVKATPNSQKIRLNFIRVDQATVLANIIK